MQQNDNFNITDLWSRTLSRIREKITSNEFSAWFERLRFSSVEGNTLVLFVPSAFFRDKFESQYKSMLEDAFEAEAQSHFEIVFKIKKEDRQADVKLAEPEVPAGKNTPVKTKPANSTLNSAYTFDSFIPGENSNFAYSAAVAIAKNPGSVYNPCLLYGGVGLGKTHLLQSIGNYISDSTDLKVVYVTAENFTNEFTDAVKNKTTRAFQNKYRKASVLLIDDIQFLQDKPGTQQELFSTFNDLYDTGRQIVFTCDRPVEDLKDITERLRSRFERGLNIDIQPPNYETRVAILKAKCEQRNFKISPDVIDYIAANISTNVRTLEACITKLMAYSELLHQEISMDTARQQLKQIIITNNDTSGLSIDMVVRAVSSYFNVSPFDIKGKSKNKSIVVPRQIAMYLCRNLTDFSTTEIASEFGGKNHTTVMYNAGKIEALLESGPNDASAAVEKLTAQIKSEIKH